MSELPAWSSSLLVWTIRPAEITKRPGSCGVIGGGIWIGSRNLGSITEQFARFQQDAAERDRITDERFRQTDKRIDALVSAIGEFLRQRSN
jgi:hypothetical protein